MTHTLQLVLIHNSNQSNGVDTALVQWITAVVQDRSEFALSVVEPFDLRFIDDFSEQPGRQSVLESASGSRCLYRLGARTSPWLPAWIESLDGALA